MSTPDNDDEAAKEVAQALIDSVEAILQPGLHAAIQAETAALLTAQLNQVAALCSIFKLVHMMLAGMYSEEFMEEVSRMMIYRFFPHPTDFSTDQMMVMRDMGLHRHSGEAENGDGESNGG